MPDNAGNRSPFEGGTYLETGQLWSGGEVAVLRSFFDAKDAADAARRKDAERRIDVYRDDWLGMLKGRISRMYARENAQELMKVADVTNNPLKRIIDSVSTIYDRPPTWKFAEGVDGSTWKQVISGAKANVVQPELNRTVNLCNEGLLYVSPTRTRLRLHVVPPSDLVAWEDPDDPTSPVAIMLWQGMANTQGAIPCWHYWSRSETNPTYQRFDVRGRRLQSMPNPYRNADGHPALPAVLYHRRWPTSALFDQTSGRDLLEMTILLAILETLVNHLLRTDSQRQKYATGLLDPNTNQTGGTNSILQFRTPEGGTVSVGEFSSQSDWPGLGGVLSRKLQNALNNHGLSLADFQVQGDAQSGFALQVRKSGLMEIRERQLPLYESYDLELYDTVASVWNFEIGNAARPDLIGDPLLFAEDAEPTIRYSAFQTALTVQERQAEMELAKERIAMGLESPLTIYMAEHPSVSEEEAREAIEKNLEDARVLSSLGASAVARSAVAAGAAPPGSAAPTMSDILAQRIAARLGEKPPGKAPAELPAKRGEAI